MMVIKGCLSSLRETIIKSEKAIDHFTIERNNITTFSKTKILELERKHCFKLHIA